MNRICFKAGQTTMTPPNASPPLAWTGAPAGTMSFAVSLFDTNNGFTHWVMWDIPATVTSLPAMLPNGPMPAAPAPAGSMQRGAPFDKNNGGYTGPGAAPPLHRYQFQVWALSAATLNIGQGVSSNAIHDMMLPKSSMANATLEVWGDQTAECP
jgi:Raf kinase inhibitor-like YbhB/YbcL family protein